MVLIFFIVLYLDMSFFAMSCTAHDKAWVVDAFAMLLKEVRYSGIETGGRELFPPVVE